MADENETNPPANPPADPPADPPAPPEDQAPDDVRAIVTELAQRVDTLTAQVESMTVASATERDTAPSSRPWTSRGRR